MMTKTNHSSKSRLNTKSIHDKKPVLSDEINAAIASKITPTIPAPEVAMRIKTKLMQRVQAETHQFVFANQGEWKQVFEGVQIKLLRKEGAHKSFLMKMAANSSIPKHLHAHDEESFVLEGSVVLEGILCHAGDYHYAQAGSQHQTIETLQGCTLLVRSL
jgi:anti-sigma factor ChrR (cupin superfamily)